MTKILFFHGGPGLNSNPEKNLLTTKFKEAGYNLQCWNEPSPLRPNNLKLTGNAYQDYLNSAEDFLITHAAQQSVIIIAHSFSANIACYLAKKHPAKLKHLVFVATSLSSPNTDINTFNLITDDYRAHDDKLADELEIILKNYTGAFDKDTLNGFSIVLQNPRLFDYYFYNEQIKQQFLSYYTTPDYVFDFEGYVNVRETWYSIPLNLCKVATTAFFGKQDKIVSNKVEKNILTQYFEKLNLFEFEISAHYPHIEETDLFLKILTQQVNQIYGSS